MQPEELTDDEYTDIKKECGCDEKGEDVSEEVMLNPKFMLKELLKIFLDIERAKLKALETDLN